eukprot:3678819-Rhodomonas_salina.1
MISRSGNKNTLNELTVRLARYVERSRSVNFQSLRAHFVVDVHDTIWLTGCSHISLVSSPQPLFVPAFFPRRRQQLLDRS